MFYLVVANFTLHSKVLNNVQGFIGKLKNAFTMVETHCSSRSMACLSRFSSFVVSIFNSCFRCNSHSYNIGFSTWLNFYIFKFCLN